MDKQDNSLKPSSTKSVTNESSISKENIIKGRGRKRRRLKSESDSDSELALPENTLEFEKNLHASALKNNLDDISVKKILKKVVTNDHVLALVKLREEEEDSDNEHPGVEPKRTRSKTKELMKVDPDRSLWPIQLSPIKEIPVKTRPEVTALIAQELPEDEDDEEYKPTHDEVLSDDDQTLESCSDLDSLPRTPATPHQTASPGVLKDGPFKVPQDTPARRKLIIEEEEATIALRTRSKLSLSHTPIEHIESSFVPPDDIPTPAVDDLWSEFLNDVLNPASVTRHEDDDEADPEYNVAADPDAKEEDEDGLERILKISKKELSDLMTELLHVMPEPEDITDVLNVQGQHDQISNRWEGKQEPLSDNENEIQASNVVTTEKRSFRYSIGKTEIEDPDYEGERNTSEANGDRERRTEEENGNVTKSKRSVDISIEEQSHSVRPAQRAALLPPRALRQLAGSTARTNTMYITVDDGVHFLPEQIQLLQQQLRQHIQLATSNFLQLYVNPTHWAMAPPYKEYLEQLHNIYKKNPKSVVNVCNLVSAVELVDSWEKSVSDDTLENKKMIEFIQKEEERWRRRYANNANYIGDFPEIFKQVIANSTVFLYPYLLPPRPYRTEHSRRFRYSFCEDELIALGLEQFWQYVYNNPQLYKPPTKLVANRRWGLGATLQLVCKYMLPWSTPRNLFLHIQKIRKDKENPITKFFESDSVEPMKHKLLPFGPNLTLYEQPEHEMPQLWVRYLAKSSKRFKNHLYKDKSAGLPPDGVAINMGEIIGTPQKTPLPIDFTKTIVCNRYNVKEKLPIVHIPDKYDVEVVSNNANVPQSNIIVVGNTGANVASRVAVQSNGNVVGNLIPVNTLWTPERNQTVNQANKIILTPQGIPNKTILVPSGNILKPQTRNVNNLVLSQNGCKYQIIVSNGNILVPMVPNSNNTTTNQVDNLKESNGANNMNSANKRVGILLQIPNDETPCSNNVSTKITEEQTDKRLKYHCKCCLILKRINNQKKITDFFKRNDNGDEDISNTCDCNNRSYSKISKRLKLFISYFKRKSWCVYKELENKMIKEVMDVDREDEDYNLDDIATVTSYQIKLAMRTDICRDRNIKQKVFNRLSKFDPDSDDPLTLANYLFKHFGVDLVDLYKEFIMFLTPYQAEKIEKFKEYFVLCIVDGLVKKIEKEIKDKERRIEIISLIKDLSTDSASTSCEMCTSLLNKMFGYPQLAAYVFEQFPHKSRQMEEEDSHIEDKVKRKYNKNIDPSGSDKTALESENDVCVCNAAETGPAEEMDQDNVEEPLVIDDSSSHIADEMASPCSEGDTLVEQKQDNSEGLLVIDYEADNSSSVNEDSQSPSPPESPQQNHEPKTEPAFHHSFEDSNNVIDTPELTISKTEVQDYDSTTDMSMLVMSEDDATIKSEPPEWKRDEDKHILQVLLEHLSPKDRQDKSILEIIEERSIYKMLSESLTDKSISDIKDRVMYLLNILVLNDLK